jgi:ABC-type nitrate/sulfonate/bicarbonate transport system substrate-binding protein
MHNVTRRRFLHQAGALVGTIGLADLLVACGSDDKGAPATAAVPATTVAGSPATTAAASAPPAAFGDLTYKLNWVNDVSSAGIFIADAKGYYKEAGFTGLTMVPGGPNTPAPEASVSGGDVLIGTSGPPATEAANAAGTKLTIIGAQLQKNPLCILSLAKTPISTPAELAGKTIGLVDGLNIQWESFLAANGVDPSSVTVVPAGYDPTPLTVGDWDGYVAYSTNEPIAIELAGFPPEVMLWADFGYTMCTQTYVVNTADLTDKRDEIKAALITDIRGWRDNIADPAYGASLVIDTYGKDLGLTLEHQQRVNAAQIELMVTPDTDANGLFTISDALLAEVVATMASAGTTVDPSTLFDLSLLAEIYEEHPDLKAPVTAG